MKNEMCLALILLAVLPAHAQKATDANCVTNADAMTLSARDYAVRVDGLLRDVHARLQQISESMEAERVTPEQGRELKLAATREMIARLDTISAVYDARLDLNEQPCPNADAVTGSAFSSDGAARHSNRTVSVKELRQEAVAAAATPRREQAAQ